jgi:hypothetical protein
VSIRFKNNQRNLQLLLPMTVTVNEILPKYWGWELIILLSLSAVAVIGGGSLVNAKVRGRRGWKVLPAVYEVQQIAGLVRDGVAFSMALARGRRPSAAARAGLLQAAGEEGAGAGAVVVSAGAGDSGNLAKRERRAGHSEPDSSDLAELKRKLKERGMSTKGSKATLRLRLLEAAAEGPPSGANVPDEGGGGGGGGRGGCASVLHQAASLGKASQLRKRLGDGAAKALLNTGDERQYTPFHVACAGGHADCVRLLLEAGCDTALYNHNGVTGWELANLLHRDEVLALRGSAAASPVGRGTPSGGRSDGSGGSGGSNSKKGKDQKTEKKERKRSSSPNEIQKKDPKKAGEGAPSSSLQEKRDVNVVDSSQAKIDVTAGGSAMTLSL